MLRGVSSVSAIATSGDGMTEKENTWHIGLTYKTKVLIIPPKVYPLVHSYVIFFEIISNLSNCNIHVHAVKCRLKNLPFMSRQVILLMSQFNS